MLDCVEHTYVDEEHNSIQNMDDKKYRLEHVTFPYHGEAFRLIALRTFNTPIGVVKEGDVGGLVQNEKNLSHQGSCWIWHDACALEDALVVDDAQIYDKAVFSGSAIIRDNALVYGQSRVSNDSIVGECVRVYGNAHILGKSAIRDFAQVFEYATISNGYLYEHASIKGYARITDGAHIDGHATVQGYSEISNAAVTSNAIINIGRGCRLNIINFGHIGYNGYITGKPNEYICIGPLGSRKDNTTFYTGVDGKIYVCCGCFNGTLDEFQHAVYMKHFDNEYLNEYKAAIMYAIRKLKPALYNIVDSHVITKNNTGDEAVGEQTNPESVDDNGPTESPDSEILGESSYDISGAISHDI